MSPLTRTTGRKRPTATPAPGVEPASPGRTAPTATAGTVATAQSTATHTAPTQALVLGRYRLHKPLGVGGFGSVWSARDERLERDVAVKVLPRERVIGGRFEREARAAARLSHPAIVTLYEAAVDDDAAYLVSELVRGQTFAQLLDEGRLSDRDVVLIGIVLCDALEHAHACGVVHRDVKPSNVLVQEHPASPAQVAKLTDFGVARLIGGNPLTRTGDVVGTAAYMAPEQAEGREVDAAGDLYSLALVLYEALTGVNPIETSAAGRARRLGAHLPPLRRHRRDLPRGLGLAIDLALRPRPSERGTVADLREALVAASGVVDDEPGVIDPDSPPQQTGGEPWAPEDRIPLDRIPLDRLPPPAGARAPGPPQPAERSSLPLRWPERSLAGASAALIAGWVCAAGFHSPPVAPAGAAAIAALAVATLPRVGWIGLIVATSAALAAAGRSGTAGLVGIALAIPIGLMPRSPTRWPLAAVAPAAGTILLAGAWPALAGRDHWVWRRAALGALGWIWLLIAGLIGGHGVYTDALPGIPPRALWTGSINHAFSRVVWPSVHSGVLAPAVVWAAAAVLLPWLLRGPLRLRIVIAVVWSAGVTSATSTILRSLHPGVTLQPGAAVIGAVAAGVVALGPTLLGRRQNALPSSDTAGGLA